MLFVVEGRYGFALEASGFIVFCEGLAAFGGMSSIIKVL